VANGLRMIPAGIEEARFKRVDQGWLFAAASPWFIGPTRTYIVDDARKVALAKAVRRAGYLRMFLPVPLLALLMAAMVAEPAMRDPLSPWAWGASAVFFLALLVTFVACEQLMLRGLLRGMPRSAQKIHAGDKLRAHAGAMSSKTLGILATFSLLFAAYDLHQMLTATGAADRFGNGATAAMFALGGGWLLAALIVKTMRRRKESV